MKRIACSILLHVASAWSAAADITDRHVPDLLQPQVAVAPDGAVHVVGVGPDRDGSDVLYTTWAGDAPPAPLRTINDQPRSATCIGTVRGARLALGRDGTVHIAWNGRDGKAFWYSRAFGPQRNLLPAGQGVDGGGAIAADATGAVAIAFHHGPAAGDEDKRRISLALSRDDGATWASPRALALPAPGVCACCSLALGLDAKGRPELLFRNAGKAGRDQWFVDGDGRGRDIGAWKVMSCPMSTAAIARTPTGTYLAWEQEKRVWWMKVGREPVPAGEGKHPALAVDAQGAVLIAWAAGTGWNRGGEVRWQAYDARGEADGAAGSRPGLAAWNAPAAFASGPGRFTILW